MKLLLTLLALLGMSQPVIAPVEDRYAVGQIWEYRNLPRDAGSLLKIQAIETDPVGGTIYHISVTGLKIEAGGGVLQEIGHLPVSKQTLDASVTRLSPLTPDFPDAAPGIADWRKANGGVFTISVAEIVGVIEQSLRQNSG
ncbi:hypothetical protein P1X14_21145 [Sphingomonas sp. AOB5]|uniref:hypothetical protein n=1 Tax=Sphingomonas sp. AOB5 TaxID=3034017 RepID=UPI0023F8B38E|nr:hypothetical protein [Sphingomonas sp. AOB5]MDF7777775.1 hypothetical protein [Sphingomonas sp. AOB5]